MIQKRLDEYTGEHLTKDANLANIMAILKENMVDINWVGIYVCDNENQVLNLSHFQGKPAVAQIKYTDGVCGRCVREEQTIVIQDVHSCPEHIVCDIDSRSELVTPIFDQTGKMYGVLDVDASIKSRFTEVDQKIFEYITNYISKLIFK